MLHVGLEHVGSLHVSYTCIELLVSWQLNDYRLSLLGLNLNLRITLSFVTNYQNESHSNGRSLLV